MTGVALQEQGAHHGSGGQGNEERNADRNAKTTRITSVMEMIRVISTSCTEARMVVVRSMATLRCNEGEMEARKRGSRARMRSTVSIMFAPGWRKMASITDG